MWNAKDLIGSLASIAVFIAAALGGGLAMLQVMFDGQANAGVFQMAVILFAIAILNRIEKLQPSADAQDGRKRAKEQ